MTIIARHHLTDLESKLDPPRYPYGQNATGYGRKIATAHMVKLPGSNRWRRVYCCQYSNAGTCYVTAGKDWIVII
jgi:hypothetical protein